MMRKLYLSILSSLLIASTAYAAECFDLGERYGAADDSSTITVACFNRAQALASSVRKAKDNGNRDIIGFENILYLYDADGELIFISGENSRLNDIQAVAYNPENNRVMVIDRSPEQDLNIYGYLIESGGNLVPVQILPLDDGLVAPKLEIDSEAHRFIITDQGSDNQVHYHLDANIRNTRNPVSTSPLNLE
jgi:hypothetical protein